MYAVRLEVIRKVYEQQKYMYDNGTHSVPDRIVSISQPYIRPIVRGKAKSPTEFGAKLDLSIDDNGMARIEKQSFDAYNESDVLTGAVQRYFERTGHYPERVLADKIYRNRNNLRFCKKHGIRLSGPPLGRPKKNPDEDRRTTYTDAVDRIEVERKFSLAKRCYGLGLYMHLFLFDTVYNPFCSPSTIHLFTVYNPFGFAIHLPMKYNIRYTFLKF